MTDLPHKKPQAHEAAAAPTTSSATAQPPTPAQSRWLIAVTAGMVIAAGTTAAFWKSVDARFISWDDPDYMYFVWDHTKKEGVVPRQDSLYKDARGLAEIWNPFSKRIQQFYPLVFSSYWIEYQIWGMDPRGYHAVNLALHVINAMLVLLVFMRFGASVWVAAFAAAVFALHPAQVASVVWVAERKNTLSTLFYLLAFLAYLRSRRPVAGEWDIIPAARGGSRRQMTHRDASPWGSEFLAFYLLSLGLYAAALLSKTQTLTLPLTLLLTDVILQARKQVSRVSLQSKLLLIAPMLLLSGAAALLTRSVEYSKNEQLVRSTIEQRVFIVPSSMWYYVKTFLWPFDLVPVYPRWDISPANPWMWAALISLPIAAGLVWLTYHRGWLDGLSLWGIVQFFLVLFPVLGFVHFNYQQYTWAADHYLYLASMAGALAVGVAGERLARHGLMRVPISIAAIGIVIGCGMLTFKEVGHWQNTETFWSRTLERNPQSYPANLNLGNHYARIGQPAKAMPLYKAAMEINPITTSAYEFYINHLSRAQGAAAVLEEHRNRLRLAREAEAAGRYPEAYRRFFSVNRLLTTNSAEKLEAAEGVRRLQPRARG